MDSGRATQHIPSQLGTIEDDLLQNVLSGLRGPDLLVDDEFLNAASDLNLHIKLC